jgi:carbamoyl-phosphate synthase large subunit
VTVNDADKGPATEIVRRFHDLGFRVLATAGTARHIRAAGIPVETVQKVHEGSPNGIDLMLKGEVQLLINTPLGKDAQRDDYTLRQAAITNRVAYTTTLSAASAACEAIAAARSREISVRSLQEWHSLLPHATPA